MGVDFVDFSFNGRTNRQLNISRVSDGSRYTEQLLPQLKDTTVDPEGVDGVLFFNTFYKTKQITLNIAFDAVTETQLREIRKIFCGRQPADLIFYERPYKIYNAKVTGTPEIKVIPFRERLVSGSNTYILPANDPIRSAIPGDDGVRTEMVYAENPVRIYKGEGTITLSAFTPYAHTPENGKYLDGAAYSSCTNISDWAESAGLLPHQTVDGVTYDSFSHLTNQIRVYNPGDLPTPFVLKFQTTAAGETSISLGKTGQLPEYVLTLNSPSAGAYFLLDSKQGLIYNCDSSYNPISVANNYITGGTALFKIGLCTIEDDYRFTLSNVSNATILYNYLYF